MNLPTLLVLVGARDGRTQSARAYPFFSFTPNPSPLVGARDGQTQSAPACLFFFFLHSKPIPSHPLSEGFF
jgi:hypothetical protein